MGTINNRRLWGCFIALSCFVFITPVAPGQGKPPTQRPDEDVVRVSTELVQTDVMVFDKKGHFVDGLKPEQFVLKIDNKPQTISFFERVGAGIRGSSASQANNDTATTPNSTAPKAITRGRTIIFFIDDVHLAPASLVRTRKSLLEFIDHGMKEGDQVAITSVSGQIGFLQQFTDNKLALRQAVARLNYRTNTKTDMEQPPMSENIALKIRDGDEQALTFYSQQIQQQSCAKINGELICTVTPQSAILMVKARANQIAMEAAPDTANTLRLLEGLMRSAGQLPGRKLVFLISDGFNISDQKAGAMERIRRVTEAAGRAGVIIYTLDARGMISEALDVTNDHPIDSKGLTAGANIGEIAASQDGLNALAGDTGGRAFRNTDAPMSQWVDGILDETSNYYLLAWRPDNEEQKRGKFNRIEASIIGRPDLTVRFRRGYFRTSPPPILTTNKKSDKDPTKARENDMRLVIDAPVSQRQIPVELELRLLQMPGVGTQLNASIQIGREALAFEPVDGKQVADVDIGGIFYDDKGKPVGSFVGRLRIFAKPKDSSSTKHTQAVYNFSSWLPAGLYQVRVGMRDIRSGRIGSAMEWIEVLNLSTPVKK